MNVRKTVSECIRILKLAKKPDKEELVDILRVCLVGMTIIGTLGFVVYVISVIMGL